MASAAELLVNLLINSKDEYSEGLSTACHSYQAASLAKRAGARSAVILATLFHDIGHAFAPDDTDGCGAAAHAQVGARVLHLLGFNRDVCELVRQHANAKRYLVAIDQGYASRLSPASRVTLKAQGGPMRPSEIREFEQLPLFIEMLQLRRYDDAAKDTSAPEPTRAQMLALVQQQHRSRI